MANLHTIEPQAAFLGAVGIAQTFPPWGKPLVPPGPFHQPPPPPPPPPQSFGLQWPCPDCYRQIPKVDPPTTPRQQAPVRPLAPPEFPGIAQCPPGQIPDGRGGCRGSVSGGWGQYAPFGPSTPTATVEDGLQPPPQYGPVVTGMAGAFLGQVPLLQARGASF